MEELVTRRSYREVSKKFKCCIKYTVKTKATFCLFIFMDLKLQFILSIDWVV